MNGKKARAARRAQRVPGRATRERSAVPWKAIVIAVAAAVISASFVVPKLFEKSHGGVAGVRGHAAMASAQIGTGLGRGSAVPAFAERSVETGKPVTSASLYNRKTLLFFSEGVMCQACFAQIKALEQMSAQLRKSGIDLVSITPDSPGSLEQAIRQYGITSPMISDEDLDMSTAFNTLGRGMHGDTPGHAFALIERGKVLWYHDYWLPPDRTMYVDPARVLADLRRLS